MSKYVADFETTRQGEDCRVWAWGICEIGNEENFQYGLTMDTFMSWCKMQAKIDNDNPEIFFHNLKFDGEFLFSWLLHNDYKIDLEGKKTNNTFDVVISELGQFFMTDIIFKKQNRKYQKVTFYDSLKKLPFKVEKIAEAFHLPLKKLDLNHDKERPLGYVMTDEEMEYLKHDCQIVAKALHIQFEQGLTKMTIGGDALKNFKEIFGKTKFKKTFPILGLDVDKDIREGVYKGGFTYANPIFQNEDVGAGCVYDTNSHYPNVMYNYPLPYGSPIWFDGEYEEDSTYPLYITKILCKFDLKKDHIPTLQLKGNFAYTPTEYVVSSQGEREFVRLTNVDLEQFLEHYVVTDIEYFGGYKFKAQTGFFRKYIDYWMKIKAENTGALRELAKLMLNNLYGKMGTNPIMKGKYPALKKDISTVKGDPNYIPEATVKEYGTVQYLDKEEERRKPIYTPLAVFTTSWGRSITIKAAQLNFDRFLYADTDSLHLLGTEPPKGIEVDKTKLGAWKSEGNFEKARFICAKRYLEVKNGKEHVTCSGMPDNVKEKVTWDNFKLGLTLTGKLIPKRVPGGVILEEGEFTLRA